MNDFYTDTDNRYRNDVDFRAAVDMLQLVARQHGFTPGELKQIAFKAALELEVRSSGQRYYASERTRALELNRFVYDPSARVPSGSALLVPFVIRNYFNADAAREYNGSSDDRDYRFTASLHWQHDRIHGYVTPELLRHIGFVKAAER